MSTGLAKLDNLVGFVDTVQPVTLTAIETLQNWEHMNCSNAKTKFYVQQLSFACESQTCDFCKKNLSVVFRGLV